jgi:hypothetical protein
VIYIAWPFSVVLSRSATTRDGDEDEDDNDDADCKGRAMVSRRATCVVLAWTDDGDRY